MGRSPLLALFALLCAAVPALAQSERVFQKRFCAGMEQEVRLPDLTRIDCLSANHAIEVDFTHKWAEAIGQSLHYAAATGKLPGVILVCKAHPYTCLKHLLAYQSTLAAYRVDITTWACDKTDQTLGECRKIGLGCAMTERPDD